MLICQQCRGDRFAPTFPYTSARARSDRIDTICGVEERGVEKQGMQPPSEGGGGKELEFVKSLLLAFCVAIANVVKHTHTHTHPIPLCCCKQGQEGWRWRRGISVARCCSEARIGHKNCIHIRPCATASSFAHRSTTSVCVCVCVSVAGKMCWFTIVMFDSSFNFPSTPHCVCVWPDFVTIRCEMALICAFHRELSFELWFIYVVDLFLFFFSFLLFPAARQTA